MIRTETVLVLTTRKENRLGEGGKKQIQVLVFCFQVPARMETFQGKEETAVAGLSAEVME